MTIFWGLGGGIGAIGGGALGQWLYNNVNKAAMPLFTGITVASATIPMWWLTNANLLSTPLFVTLLLAVTGGMLSSTAGPLNKAMLLNVNEPETRGVALAWQTMTDDLGKGLGPALVAALISALGRFVSLQLQEAETEESAKLMLMPLDIALDCACADIIKHAVCIRDCLHNCVWQRAQSVRNLADSESSNSKCRRCVFGTPCKINVGATIKHLELCFVIKWCNLSFSDSAAVAVCSFVAVLHALKGG